MRMKKTVSAVAALAMSASVFAGLATVANAEETKTLIYSNDFESGSDFTVGGRTDGVTYNPATSKTNTKSSQIIGRGSASGDANLTSPSFTALEEYGDADSTKVIDVSFDFKIDGTSQGKASNIALLGGANNSGWLNSSEQILTINAPASGNGYQTVNINGTDVTAAIGANTNGTYENNVLNRNTTGWVTLNARINFTTGSVHYSLTKAGSVVSENDTAFVNAGVNKLDRLFIAAGKSYGGAYIDNLSVTKIVDDSVSNHAVTFTEKNGVAATVTVNGNDVTSGTELPDGTYTYTATAEGYFDCTGKFTISGADVAVDFEMVKKNAPGAVTIKYVDAESNTLYSEDVDLTDKYATEQYTYYYPAYVLYNGEYYKADAAEYGAAITLTEEAQPITVNYTKSDKVIAVVEETEVAREKNDASGYGVGSESGVRFSNGAAITTQGTGSYLAATVNIPADGNYTFSGPLYNSNSKSRKVDLRIDDASSEIIETIEVAAGGTGEFSIDADLTAGEHTFIFSCNYSLTPSFDYVVVTQNSVKEPVVDATVAYTSEDFTTEADAPVRVYKATITPGTYTVTGVKWNVTVDGNETPASAEMTTSITNAETVVGAVVVAKNVTLDKITGAAVELSYDAPAAE